MRWDALAQPVAGLDDTLALIDDFDAALSAGFARPGPVQTAALAALGAGLATTPLGQRVTEAGDKVAIGSASETDLAALAGARSGLFGAVHDALIGQLDEATGRHRATWTPHPVEDATGGDNLRAATRSWLTELAIAGWLGVDHDLVSGAAPAIHGLLGAPRLRRLAVLLDGFAAELAASAPVATMPAVPQRRWADLWSRALLLAQPGGRFGDTVTATVSGRLLPLGVDLHEHGTVVQAQVHAVLEPTGGGPAWLVRVSVSATKVDTLVGPVLWRLLTAHPVLLGALAAHRSIDITDMPVTAGGDLVWLDGQALAGEPADPFTTARVLLAGALAPATPPLDRHPARIAEPVLVEGYTAVTDDKSVRFEIGGHPIAVDTGRLPAAGPLTPALVGASTACIALLRWDAGRWTLQPLAVQATVKRKPIAAHTGDWATGPTDAVAKKADAAAGDAVAVLRERAGRLLRS